MSSYQQSKEEELMYLNKTLKVIETQLAEEENTLSTSFKNLINSGREMWEESVHFSNDFDKIPEMNQYLLEVNNQNRDYAKKLKRIKKYKQMLNSPYFGRFDFLENGFDSKEKIYIGLYNLMEAKTDSIFIYDWRAPISSIFYRHEAGEAYYNSPVGIVSGKVYLKRQYKIQDSNLKFFFDSNIRITDEILQEVLSRNSSAKMKNIVETIQKEQDAIIRDTENELLIIQGVAGSGKTSVALHRIAFLLYEGLNSKINSNDVIIVSPNSIFSKYISNVLPELGEEHVEEITFDDIASKFLDNRCMIEARGNQLENLIIDQKNEKLDLKVQGIEFKGSEIFVEILDRLIQYYERNLHNFEDVYYEGKIIETKQQLKNMFLNNKIDIPMVKRLRRIESIILNKIYPLRKERLRKIEKVVQNNPEHIFEVKSFSRLISIKETKVFMKHIHSFTKVHYMDLYKILFNKNGFIFKLSKGLELPKNIEQIIWETSMRLEKGYISYEDCAPLIYIKLKIEGNDNFSNIRQVVIDEAQDYYSIQYNVFRLLFKGARYTVLGDFNQTLERNGDKFIYDNIERILNKRKSVKMSMSKSYRASFEINNFNKRFLNSNQEITSFKRHEAEPIVIFKNNQEVLDRDIVKDIEYYYKQGYDSVAIICKTKQQAREIEERLKDLIDVKVLNEDYTKIEKGTLIVPSYLAKGLEFDVVLVYDVSNVNYETQFDRRLLYIACTRALHRLKIYFTGEKSRLL
ncbi:HelD family protein [Clostridium sp. JNZ J1-5]